MVLAENAFGRDITLNTYRPLVSETILSRTINIFATSSRILKPLDHGKKQQIKTSLKAKTHITTILQPLNLKPIFIELFEIILNFLELRKTLMQKYF